MYGCAATFAGVWAIAWEPTSKGPATGSNDTEGTINDAEREGHGLLFVDTSHSGGVGRRPGGSTLRTRRSTVSLVGISPTQVRLKDFYIDGPIR